MIGSRTPFLAGTSILVSALVGIPAAHAQQAASSAAAGDIIVTARKRQESVLHVPVIETVVTQERIERLQVTQLTDLAKIVPGLSFGRASLSIGTLVSLRGIGTSASDHGVDQSVSLNIDGLSLGQGLAFSSGLFDVGQIEVLKGPQALFYGKSSPGGVIALSTANPTDRFELKGSVGYEVESRTTRGELIVSGPVTDQLKLRLAGMYSAGDGYFKNIASVFPGTGAALPAYDRAPRAQSFVLRGTALWAPAPNFDARLKATYVYDNSIEPNQFQLVSCAEGINAPSGTPFVGGGEDCKLDRIMRVVAMDPAAFPGIPNNGVPFLTSRQRYGTLEMNYRPADGITVTSTTGYYKLTSRALTNSLQTTFAGTPLASSNILSRRDFTQEIRVNSDFSSPLNFFFGGYFQDGKLDVRVKTHGNIALRQNAALGDGKNVIDIKAYSAFGQLRWKIVPELELAGGLRWTNETRKINAFNFLTNAVIPLAVPKIRADNAAPEITLTYRPSDDQTFFVAYKKGYKSGSFNTSSIPAANANTSFGDESVQGGEVGWKSRLLDRQLTLNIAGYYYKYKGLQVGVIVPTTAGTPTTRTVNAGSARTYGVDFEAAFRPASVDGLGLNLAINWNDGRYQTLNNVPCYGGQTIAAGCNQFLNPATGFFTAQDLSGTPLVRAPRWRLTGGFDYEFPVGSKYKLTISNNNTYSSRYVAALAANRSNDDNYQRAYFKTDASLAFGPADDRWEVALIGKNLTDRVIFGQCSVANFRNGAIFGGQVTGGTGRGAAGVSDIGCFAEAGREVWVRLTVRPFS